MTDAERQSILDDEHLRLLRIGHIIMGVTSAFFSVFALFYAAMGTLIGSVLTNMPHRAGAPDPRAFGMIFAFFGGIMFLFLCGGAILKLCSARFLRLRRHRTFCQIAAAVSCIEIPYGTILGIMTFQVLARPSVAALFGANAAYPPYPPQPPYPLIPPTV